MAVTLSSGRISLSVLTTLLNTLDLNTVTDELRRTYTTQLSHGNAINKAEMVWHDQRTIAASGNEDLDLAGVLASTLNGATLTFTKIKGIIIRAADGNTNNVNVTRPASNGLPFLLAAGDGMAVKPGGLFALIDPSAAGYAVTAGTGDLINIANSGAGTSVTYDVIIIGTTS